MQLKIAKAVAPANAKFYNVPLSTRIFHFIDQLLCKSGTLTQPALK